MGDLATVCVVGEGKLDDGDIVTEAEPDVKPCPPAPNEPLRPVRIGITGDARGSLFALGLLDPALAAAAPDVGGARSKLGVEALAPAFPLLRFPVSVPRSAAC